MTPKEEVETLMNEMIPFAKRMLRDHGEFHPYGGFLQSGGEITHVGAQADAETPEDLLEVLVGSFRAKATNPECKATAIVFNVVITPPGKDKKSGAIQVNVDHREDYSAEVFIPYRLVEGSVPEYGEIFAQEGAHQIFRSTA